MVWTNAEDLDSLGGLSGKQQHRETQVRAATVQRSITKSLYFVSKLAVLQKELYRDGSYVTAGNRSYLPLQLFTNVKPGRHHKTGRK